MAERVVIPSAELRFEFSRSSGPGGQNVNKVSTRVSRLFDVANSTSLTTDQKAAVRRTLGSRINREGILRVISSRHRTQSANRLAAVRRFEELIAGALRPRKPRKKTRPTAAAHAKRLEAKAQRGQTKRHRAAPPPE